MYIPPTSWPPCWEDPFGKTCPWLCDTCIITAGRKPRGAKNRDKIWGILTKLQLIMQIHLMPLLERHLPAGFVTMIDHIVEPQSQMLTCQKVAFSLPDMITCDYFKVQQENIHKSVLKILQLLISLAVIYRN